MYTSEPAYAVTDQITINDGTVNTSGNNPASTVFDNSLISAGKSYASASINIDGSCLYFCQVHPWMANEITIGTTLSNVGSSYGDQGQARDFSSHRFNGTQGMSPSRNNMQGTQGMSPSRNNMQGTQGMSPSRNNMQGTQGMSPSRNNMQGTQGTPSYGNNMQGTQGTPSYGNNMQGTQGMSPSRNNMQGTSGQPGNFASHRFNGTQGTPSYGNNTQGTSGQPGNFASHRFNGTQGLPSNFTFYRFNGTQGLPGNFTFYRFNGTQGQLGNSTSSSQQQTTTLDPTSTTVTLNTATVSSGGTASFTVQVSDTSSSPTTPTGTISWSDDDAGGTFNPSSCTLSSGSCTTSYIPSTSPPSSVTITASYGGDSAHATSSGIFTLTINQINPTSTTVTPNTATLSSGGTTFTVQVSDTSSSPTTPTGTISWNDNNSDGTFNPSSCTLSSGSCTTSYTSAPSPPSSVTITASYGGDSAHATSSGTSILTANKMDATTTTVTSSSSTITAGSAITVTATIADTSNPSSSMIGMVSWSDNGAGGGFSPSVCTITNNQCALTYTPSTNLSSGITITATYAGDASHSGSSGTSSLSVGQQPTSSQITIDIPTGSYNQSQHLTFYPPLISANVSTTIKFENGDVVPHEIVSGVPFAPDGRFDSGMLNPGQYFTYTLAGSDVGTLSFYDKTYTWMTGEIIVGQSNQSLPVTTPSPSSPTPTGITVSTDKSSYSINDTITSTVVLSGASAGQNIGISITDPTNSTLVARTITTGSNGTAILQVKLPTYAKMGNYQVSATASVNGQNFSTSAAFTVQQNPQAIQIVSVQATDQQGNPVSSFTRGTNGYVKVLIYSPANNPSLVTVNLFDSNYTAIGIGSLQSSLGTGQSEMILSFQIPDDAATGTANIYVDTFSNWPDKGGEPLTPESSTTVAIQ